MALRRRRRMSALQRQYFGRRRRNPVVNRRRRRNPVALLNRRQRRLSARRNPILNRRRRRNPILNRRRRRGYRRNPAGIRIPLLGVSLPSIETLAYYGVGFVAPPFIEGFAEPYLPAVLTSNQAGRYVIKIGAVSAVTALAKATLGNDAARKVAVGGAVYLVGEVVRDFLPMLTGAGAGYYIPGQTNGAVGTYSPGPGNGMGSQPLLGSYITEQAPSRLMPEKRF